jgi:23S rRNA (uracil1939-C5)-methyltransferase
MPEILIEKMAFGGSGFGRIDGKSCFVPYTVPGDNVAIKVRSERRSYLYADVDKIISPGPSRIEPNCPIFGICGGCNWQHVAYDSQVQFKQEIFTEMLWRMGRVKQEVIMPIAPAPSPDGYRSRVQFKTRTINGSLVFGFYKSGTHHIVPIPGTCFIAAKSINHFLPQLHRLFENAPDLDKIPQIDIAAGIDDNLLVIVHYIGNNVEALHRHILQHKDQLSFVTGFFTQQGRKHTLNKIFGIGEINYPLGRSAHTLSSSAGGFSQINYQQNIHLAETVLEWANLKGGENILDLFCGNGNFSIPLAANAKYVLGVEGYSPSVDDAIKNAINHHADNVEFVAKDVLDWLIHDVTHKEFEIVLLDPPRSGAAESVEHIARFSPKTVIYISCDPATLARDIKIFAQFGYKVIKTRPFDLFPQTYHLESVTLLQKISHWE